MVERGISSIVIYIPTGKIVFSILRASTTKGAKKSMNNEITNELLDYGNWLRKMIVRIAMVLIVGIILFICYGFYSAGQYQDKIDAEIERLSNLNKLETSSLFETQDVF